MKKIFTIMLALTMILTVAAGCSPKGNESSSQEEIKLPSLSEVHEAVKAAYGEDYIPSMALDEKSLNEVVGLNLDSIEEVIAEGPMMSAHTDYFIAVKAKEGKGNDIKAELDKFKDYLVNDSFQYPFNMEKVKNTTVVQHGDYVFLVTLGAIYDSKDETVDPAAFAKEQEQIGLDAIENMFIK